MEQKVAPSRNLPIKNRQGQELEEARMTYEYPKAGSFRFPLDMERSQRPSRHESRRKESERHEKVETEGVKSGEQQLFQGTFEPTQIPSPVHGFQKGYSGKDKNSEHDWLIFQTRDTQADFARRLHNDNAQPLKKKDNQPAFMRKHQDLLEFEEDVLRKLRMKEPLPESSSLTEQGSSSAVKEEGEENKVVPFTQPEVQPEAVSAIHEKAVQEDVEKEEEEKNEIGMPLAIEKQGDDIQKEQEQVEARPEPELNEPGRAKTNQHVNHQLEADSVGVLEEPQKQKEGNQQPPVSDRGTTKTESRNTNTSKSSIPYNVLMLPKDKKPLSDKSQASSMPRRKKTVADGYVHPAIGLLRMPDRRIDDDSSWLDDQAHTLEETLTSFHVDARVVARTRGPAVTRFEVQPARGVKVNKITNLSDDIKLSLAAKDIRMEAPIPGKNAIGIEVPNRKSAPVLLREILRRDVFIEPKSPMTVALGLDISGQPIVTDLRKMPHGLVAGATGSGKSVCINSILVSLLYKATPDEVKLLLVDPKMVELAPYHEAPHLIAPVITDAKQATAALKWVVAEMERRYELFSQHGVRDVDRYNEKFSQAKNNPALPYMLVVIDELADLMMVSPQDVEDAICRIAQKARACGIHLLVATQRPSVDVITGLIKANIPTRISFAVSSQTDSRTILDMGGAERLLGRGDMLFHENGTPKPIRVQGTFVSDEEIEDVVAHVKTQAKPVYAFDTEQIQGAFEQGDNEDELLEEVCYFVVEHGSASASSIQRKFRVGYNRAARLVEMMEERGVVSGAMGSKPRQVLVGASAIEELF
ncbi:DNA translocase FtsK [Shouchella shacheensis]|uniref:DNA translocase FtsK n=1 Tax=Shouchella shacheensis TaxID=1649580 RepID=UPI000AB3CB1F|nr:DNA translocase FtsK [Shouchella shacheensis]